MSKHKDRMDDALAHLTFGRLDYVNNKNWSAESLRVEIGEKWIEFIDRLQALGEPAAPRFLEEARKRKVPVAAPF